MTGFISNRGKLSEVRQSSDSFEREKRKVVRSTPKFGQL
ncbi:hypothetical protein SAMD00020551_4169 [Mesobacillus selenatarsenatis SF-1]|uniref:Uncharacterized protein n=1 Tax=Mesobacillus selenatarsenatis (strain DSM 18680 / JCM 14380 / FERM P-15431 / SF-1) TaxID=1321606 RepID=A0A0A8X7W2_MESS1|nr:hypothetical protein SAMD00020551_4169 [Mesobacillus selenatarsenatis SF-1]